MPKAPTLYSSYYARDISLGLVELWSAGEREPQYWTDRPNPDNPYLLFNRVGGIVRAYYGEEGIDWIHKETARLLVSDPSFSSRVKERYSRGIKRIEAVALRAEALPLPELKEYVEYVRDLWPWFNGFWMCFHAFANMPERADELKEFLQIRKETEYLTSATDAIVRASAATLYPEYASYAHVLRLGEMLEGTLPPRAVLSERDAGYYYVAGQLLPASAKVLIENKYNIFIEEPVVYAGLSEMRGAIAYVGKARGPVRRITSVKQLGYFQVGDVLVASSTTPDFLPALQKAAAIVSDEGGVVCHAAIVARELKKPCLIGTKVAMATLRDGDLVEVDANHGLVRIIKRI